MQVVKWAAAGDIRCFSWLTSKWSATHWYFLTCLRFSSKYFFSDLWETLTLYHQGSLQISRPANRGKPMLTYSPRPPTPLSRLRSHSPWLMDGQYGLHAWRQAPEIPTAQWSTSRAVVTQFRPPRFNHDFRWCLWSLHNLPMAAWISSHTQHSCHLVGWLAIVNCPECFESGRIWWVWSWWACEENEIGFG